VAGCFRWATQSRARLLIALGLAVAFHETLVLTGFYELTETVVMAAFASWEDFRSRMEDASDWLHYFVGIIEDIRVYIVAMGWRRMVCAIALGGAMICWLLNGGSLMTPSSSRAGSSQPSGMSSPDGTETTPASPGPAQEEFYREVVTKLTNLVKTQEELRLKVDDVSTDTEAARWSEKATRTESAQQNEAALAALRQRIEDFGKVIEEDRADRRRLEARAAMDIVPSRQPPLPPPAEPPIAATSPPSIQAIGGESKSVGEVIRRLEDLATPPQQAVLTRLKEYREENKEEWARHFPPGYRTRVAPSFLAEIYSHGVKGRTWARELLKEKGLSEYSGAREFVAVLAAIDSLLLIDQTVGAINLVSTERLARKALGFYKAIKEVQSEKDWKKPSSAPKTWRSKINWEAAKRTDPAYVEETDVYVHREAEEEAKTEIEKDANLLKAYAKISEWRGVSASSTGAD